MISKPLVLYSGKLIKKNISDAGWDISSVVNKTIRESGSDAISTNLKVKIPNGCVGIVKARSGSSFKNDIEVGAGVIDENYTGEIMVKLYNHGHQPFIISKGDRIAQLLIIPVDTRDYITSELIEETDRGEDGFGSSGIGEEIL